MPQYLKVTLAGAGLLIGTISPHIVSDVSPRSQSNVISEVVRPKIGAKSAQMSIAASAPFRSIVVHF